MPNDTHAAPTCRPAQPAAPLVLLANRHVASSNARSLYCIYSSLRVSLAPCASSSRARRCVKTVYSIWISLVREAVLCPQSTALPKYLTSQVFFMRSLLTINTLLFTTAFTQPVNLINRAYKQFLGGLNTKAINKGFII